MCEIKISRSFMEFYAFSKLADLEIHKDLSIIEELEFRFYRQSKSASHKTQQEVTAVVEEFTEN